jgi:PrcB C-terminal
MTNLLRACAAAAALLLLGCAQAKQVAVTTVLSHGDCHTDASGVLLIDYAQLAQLRGARLLGMSDDGGEGQAGHLIAILPGAYPTPGYAVRVDDTAPKLSDPLVLRVSVSGPPSDAVLAQVITHPCLVVAIDDPAVQRVRVETAAAVLGEVDLSAAASPSP